MRGRPSLVIVAALLTALAPAALLGGGGPIVVAATLGVAVAVALVVVRRLTLEAESGRPRAVPARGDGGVPELRQIAKLVRAAELSDYEVDRSFRPLVAPIAELRLARHGVSLEGDPTRAEELLGSELFQLVRPGRARGTNRVEGGIGRAQIEAIIGRLEGL